MKKGSTKKALVTSIVSLFVCVTMFVGATFAWFTDSASTGVNKIQAGNLDIDLQMYEKDGWVSATGKSLAFKTAGVTATDENNNILWEPGAEFEIPTLRIVNKGNLALTYKMIVNGIVGDVDLSNVIDVYVSSTAGKAGKVKVGTLRDMMDDQNGVAYGNLLAGKDTGAYAISFKMQETAGNDYQEKSIENISFTVLATQATSEWDSTTDQYDAGAINTINAPKYKDITTLTTALQSEQTVGLANSLAEELSIKVNENRTLYLNGHTLKTLDLELADNATFTVVGGFMGNVIVNGTGKIQMESVNVKATTEGVSAITIKGEGVKVVTKSVSLVGARNGEGIRVPEGSLLDLSGSDLVVEGNNRVDDTVKGSSTGSGIGNADANVGKIYIHDMNGLTAKGFGLHAAGIGGKMTDEILIENTTINSVKGGIPQQDFIQDQKYGKDEYEGGVAIGVMVGSSSNKVTLNNVDIYKAVGGSKCAAIGAGWWATLDLDITNSTLMNIVGGNSAAGVGGARISSGSTGDLWSINVVNSAIETKGGTYGAGLGSGYDTYCTNGATAPVVTITISGKSTIKAIGGKYAAGIGTGYHAGGLKGTIEASVKTDGTVSGDKVYKDTYTHAQDIGFGVLDPSRDGANNSSSITYNGQVHGVPTITK